MKPRRLIRVGERPSNPFDGEPAGETFGIYVGGPPCECDSAMREAVEQLHDDVLDGIVTAPLDVARRLEAAAKEAR